MKVSVKMVCSDSVILEGVMEYPEEIKGALTSCLICHPHPLYGGEMGNNVVMALSRSMIEAGIATLRFNFRGVGKSAGSYGEGVSEMLDVASGLDFLGSDNKLDPSRVLLAGYSFGSWVAMKTAVNDHRPSRLIMISPPVDMYDFGFLSSEERPKFMIAGDGDFVCSVKGFNQLSEIAADPKMCVMLKGHDHFHRGSEDTINRNVREFLARYPL